VTSAASCSRCGLPATVEACLFDLDGVLTDSARVHRAAWAATFDDFLRARADGPETPFVPFTPADYTAYVDGKLRYDGVRAFLDSRGIALPEGATDDPPTATTVCGLGNRKDLLVQSVVRSGGIDAFPGSVRYLEAVRDAGLRRAVVSASVHCLEMLAGAGIAGLLEEHVDGIVAHEERLHGKPAPDTYLAAADRLGVTPTGCAVFEDARAGVEAGRAGGFGFVVGVSRDGRPEELLARGADVAVADLADLLR
jgi:beta-phosphoglucomutase family hydrolase